MNYSPVNPIRVPKMPRYPWTNCQGNDQHTFEFDSALSSRKQSFLPISNTIPLAHFRCAKKDCGGLLRPHVVWFGENLDPKVLSDTDEELTKCDLCLVVSVHRLLFHSRYMHISLSFIFRKVNHNYYV